MGIGQKSFRRIGQALTVSAATMVAWSCVLSAPASAQHRALSVRPSMQHTVQQTMHQTVPQWSASARSAVVRQSDMREAELAVSRQVAPDKLYFQESAKALGHVMERTSRIPQSGVILVAKPGFDAQTLLWDLKARRINSRIFADRIIWLGYAGQDGTFVVPQVPRGVTISGVVISEDFRPAPFAMHVRHADAETIEIAPVYLNH